MTKQDLENCKINDIVICNTSYDYFPQKNWKGKIIFKDKNKNYILVEWENKFINGHNGNGGDEGRGKNLHCRYYYYDNKTIILDVDTSSNEDTSTSLDENISILDLIKNQQLEFNFYD